MIKTEEGPAASRLITGRTASARSDLRQRQAGPIAAGRASIRSTQIAAEVLPPGYHLTSPVARRLSTNPFEGLIFALLLGIAVAYMVLASQFN